MLNMSNLQQNIQNVKDNFYTIKETDMGLIPSDWQVSKLKEIFNLKNGVNTEKNNYGKGIKFINVLEIIRNNHIKYDDIPGHISLSKESIQKYLVRNGDVLFNRTSETLDELGLAAVYLDDIEVVFGGFVIRARPINDKLDKYFSKYIFTSYAIRKQIIKMGQGTMRSNIGQEDLYKINISLPPLSVQISIAQALNDIDSLISALESIITKKCQIKQGTMQQLLTGKHRLPGFKHKWVSQPLKNLCNITKGDQLNKDTLTTNGLYPVINGGITPSGYSNKFNRNHETITISEGGNSCGFVNFIRTKFWSGGHCYSIDDPKILNEFLFQFLKFNETKIMSLRVGSGLPNIQKREISNLELFTPIDLNEQQQIADILFNIDREINVINLQLQKLKSLKQGMMQELLTGKTRLL